MKILCAPDSFKETLTATQAAQAMAAGAGRVGNLMPCDICPIGDGGEGSMDAIVHALGGEFVHRTVMGPLGQPTQARFGLVSFGRCAVIELAQAAGLTLVPLGQRNP